jgi:hypothetical protein
MFANSNSMREALRLLRFAPVEVLLAKRTFWEKVTILHAEYHRPADKALPDRYSRHYYDVAMMAQGPIRAEALSDMALLVQVVRHKETFYPAGRATISLPLRCAYAKTRITAPIAIRETPPTF